MYFGGTSAIVPGIMPCTSFTHALMIDTVASIILTHLPSCTTPGDPPEGADADRKAKISLKKLCGTAQDICVDRETMRPNYNVNLTNLTESKVMGQA